MKLRTRIASLGVVVAVCLVGHAQLPELEQAKKAVVKLSSQADGMHRVGTGFIVKLEKDAAYIATVSHVIEGDSKPQVSFYPDAQTQYDATVIGSEGDMPRGLALIRVKGTLPPGLERLGIDATFEVHAGEAMTIIGFPRLAETAWAMTPISIVGRQGTAITFTGAADEGSSGSPIVRSGWVTGIVTEKTGDFGYAVPATALRFALEGWAPWLFGEGAESAPAASAPGTSPSTSAANLLRTATHCQPERLSKTRILFSSDRDSDTTGHNVDLYLMDIDGKNVERITPPDSDAPEDQSWSPDGKSILYVDTYHPGLAIYQLDLKTRRSRNLTTDGAYFSTPLWSPDGKRIAFLANPGVGDGNDVFLLSIAGSKDQRLTHHPSSKGSLFWSPDGSRIGFSDEISDNTYATFLINTDGTGLQQISSPLTNFAGSVWSPAAKKIAGQSPVDDKWTIYVMGEDGSDPVRLTKNEGEDSQPDYSPDGCMIVFTSRRDTHDEIYRMDADGSHQMRLTTTKKGVSNNNPAWQPFPR